MENIPLKQRKILIAVIAICLFICVGIIVAVTIYRSDKINVTVKYAPFDSTVILDGKKIKNNSSTWLSPGDHTLIVEREYFDTISKDIQLSSERPYIIGVLYANSSLGEEIMKEKQIEFQIVEGILGRFANEDGIKEKEQYPILNYLPINNTLFSISYTYQEENLKIYIKSRPVYQDMAVAKLYSLKNINPAEYDILFKDFNNPFRDNFSNNQLSSPEAFLSFAYKKLLDDYEIKPGKQEDGYYYTTIQSYAGQNDGSYASYRVLLRESANSWELVTDPYPILTKHTATNVSVELLNKINQLR